MDPDAAVNDNQALPDAQPEAQLFPHNDLQCPVLAPMVYVAVVKPFKTKMAEQQKTIEELEKKNRELTLLNPLNLWKRVESDDPETMESTGRRKSFSENATDIEKVTPPPPHPRRRCDCGVNLNCSFLGYDELKRENGGLRLESEERTRLTTDQAQQLRQMENAHQINLDRIATQHAETLRIKEEANLATLAQKEQLINALRRSGEQLEISHGAQESRWGEERNGLQSQLQEKQAMMDALVETNNGLMEEIKELQEEKNVLKNEFIEELMRAENKYLESKRETEAAINEGKQMHSLQIGCALTAAVYQNRASITEWSAFEKILGDLSGTILSSLKCQIPDLQKALDLSRQMKDKYQESLQEKLEDQKKRRENAHGKTAEVDGVQGSLAETKAVKPLPLLSKNEEEEAAQKPKPSRKRGAENELVTFGRKVKSL
ncbi:Protein CBG21406 [Caenorhabditis briggsae]|uniref:Protein CBG21406 n=1 Tax=Caenorhabditis briggsae TaxID=6238 RepID=A8Y002_CAEBR|nr:Protein CBG21406 [Caenorhabditis briggsae]CAP38219.2 Protein CBG21406 [Caenorhabditis briggsae]